MTTFTITDLKQRMPIQRAQVFKQYLKENGERVGQRATRGEHGSPTNEYDTRAVMVKLREKVINRKLSEKLHKVYREFYDVVDGMLKETASA